MFTHLGLFALTSNIITSAMFTSGYYFGDNFVPFRFHFLIGCTIQVISTAAISFMIFLFRFSHYLDVIWDVRVNVSITRDTNIVQSDVTIWTTVQCCSNALSTKENFPHYSRYLEELVQLDTMLQLNGDST